MLQTRYFILLLVALAACTQNIPVTTFEECVAAGNPVMESYPRQCRHDGQLFVEEVDVPVEQPSAAFTACEEPRPELCTMQYDPVCAFQDNGIRCVTTPCQSVDAVTAGNACGACSDENVAGYYDGTCEEQRFVICKETVTGFDVAQIAKESGWICVDICPGNYDSYTSQIGAELCIAHYGEEEIVMWETCSASSESCSCVRAYETTSDEEIRDAKFRCVPEQYAERLLFRGGQERLDENGQGSVMIA